ncbi:hypothetical protein [Streptomyces sp. MS1.AVA.4]|uniref:Uncharacterized protein n=1 Tax=Streptomyces pratisoli TaxID=3139917 RepID=A0ACC6QVA1_9ACTN
MIAHDATQLFPRVQSSRRFMVGLRVSRQSGRRFLGSAPFIVIDNDGCAEIPFGASLCKQAFRFNLCLGDDLASGFGCLSLYGLGIGSRFSQYFSCPLLCLGKYRVHARCSV